MLVADTYVTNQLHALARFAHQQTTRFGLAGIGQHLGLDLLAHLGLDRIGDVGHADHLLAVWRLNGGWHGKDSGAGPGLGLAHHGVSLGACHVAVLHQGLDQGDDGRAGFLGILFFLRMRWNSHARIARENQYC